MRALQPIPTAFVIAALTWLAAPAPAHAGEPVKLAVEFPSDVRQLEPGDDLDVVQVVGIDAEGARVGFGGRSVQLAVSVGKTRVVEAPFRFGYTAPSTIDGPTAVTFTATLDGAPSVTGTARLDLLPKGPYVRLSVETTKTRVDWGSTTMVTVQGEKRGGRLVPVVKGKVLVTVDGPGSVEFVRLGAYRYTAPSMPPADGASDARLLVTIEGSPAVRGRAAVALGATGIRLPPTRPASGESSKSDVPGASDAPPAPPRGADDEQPGRDERTKNEKTDEKTNGRGKKRVDAESAASPDPGEVEPVAWPGGALGVLAWRARPAEQKGKQKMRRVRKLPEPGGEFALNDVQQRIRALVLPAGDGDVRGEWRLGDATEPLASPLGRFRVVRDRLDRRVVVIDATPPATGETLRITVIVETTDGDVRDDLVLRRKTGASNGGNGKQNGEGRKKRRENAKEK